MDVTQIDAAVLRRSRDEPHDFVVIFDRHFAAIHRYLARRVGTALADELASETFLQAFERRRFYEPTRETARPWLYGIATNLMRQHRRRETRQLVAYAKTAIDPVCADDGGASERSDAAATSRSLAAALAALNGREREAFLLLAWGELTYEEIAEALAVPIGTVRSRIHRAREKLQRALGSEPASSGAAFGKESSTWTYSS